MTSIFRDAQFALRSLLKRPGFLVTALIALTIGIGFNTAVYSFIENALLRPLPFPEPDQLVMIRERQPSYPFASLSAPDFLDVKRHNKTFEAMSGFTYEMFTWTNRDEPEILYGVQCDTDFFAVMRDRPHLGRVFTSDSPGGEAVLSYEAWKTHFQMDLKVIGKTLILNGQPNTVVGVLEEGAHYPFDKDVWVSARTPAPVSPRVGMEVLSQRGSHYFQAVGRIKPNETLVSEEIESSRLASAARMPAVYEFALNRGTVLMAGGAEITDEDLLLKARPSAGPRFETMTLEEAEKHLIERALSRAEGNVSQAAKALGLSRSALYRRLEHFGLSSKE